MKKNIKTLSQEKEKHLFYETHLKMLIQTSNLLAKGFAFYLAIIAASMGYTLIHELPPSIEKAILYFDIITSILFFSAAGTLVWFIIKAIATFKESIKETCLSELERRNINQISNKAKIAALIVSFCSCIVVLMLIVGMIFLLKRYP